LEPNPRGSFEFVTFTKEELILCKGGGTPLKLKGDHCEVIDIEDMINIIKYNYFSTSIKK